MVSRGTHDIRGPRYISFLFCVVYAWFGWRGWCNLFTRLKVVWDNWRAYYNLKFAMSPHNLSLSLTDEQRLFLSRPFLGKIADSLDHTSSYTSYPGPTTTEIPDSKSGSSSNTAQCLVQRFVSVRGLSLVYFLESFLVKAMGNRPIMFNFEAKDTYEHHASFVVITVLIELEGWVRRSVGIIRRNLGGYGSCRDEFGMWTHVACAIQVNEAFLCLIPCLGLQGGRKIADIKSAELRIMQQSLGLGANCLLYVIERCQALRMVVLLILKIIGGENNKLFGSKAVPENYRNETSQNATETTNDRVSSGADSTRASSKIIDDPSVQDSKPIKKSPETSNQLVPKPTPVSLVMIVIAFGMLTEKLPYYRSEWIISYWNKLSIELDEYWGNVKK